MSATRRTHINSLCAYFAGESGLFSKRELLILDLLREGRNRAGLTDREVMLALGFSDMNAVRPRLTELVAEGLVNEIGSKDDPVTGKCVRIVALRLDPRRAQAEFDLEGEPRKVSA